MSRNLNILNELKEQAPALAEIPHHNVFTVPDGYFEQLAVNILLKINSENEILPSGLNKKTGFEVPAGYFDHLAGNILNRIKTEDVSGAREEIGVLSPLLANISREMPFQVPHSYFDQLPERITHQQQEAKVVQMGTRSRVIPRWLKMAAAACITGILAFGVYQFATRNNGGTGSEIASNNNPTLEQVKDFNLDSELEKLSGTDINNYLCETGAIACNDSKEEELSKQLSEISDEELDKYLEGIN
jgi:hypothetical protein